MTLCLVMFTESTAEAHCGLEHKCLKYLALHSSLAFCVHMSEYAFPWRLLEG